LSGSKQSAEGAPYPIDNGIGDEMQLDFLAVDGPTPKLSREGAEWTSAQWIRDNVEIAGRM